MPSAAAAGEKKRVRRHKPLDGVYIAAQISSHEMQRLFREELTFTVGDGLVNFANLTILIFRRVRDIGVILLTFKTKVGDPWSISEHKPTEPLRISVKFLKAASPIQEYEGYLMSYYSNIQEYER